MSEETPFKSIKITLSEEAIRKLSGLRKGGSFRSDSATIEECIRTTFDISEDIFSELEIWNEKNRIQPPKNEQSYLCLSPRKH